MKLNRFEVVTGRYIEEILGQSRIGYAMSDTTDFYDMIEQMCIRDSGLPRQRSVAGLRG